MLIKREVLEAIKRGEVTLQFRRWTRPSVRPGGTLRTRVGLLQIGRMDEMSPDEVSEADAKKAGFKDRGVPRLARHDEAGPAFPPHRGRLAGRGGVTQPAARNPVRRRGVERAQRRRM